jgi:hypothetical protein
MRDYMECLGFNGFPCQVVRPRAMEGSDVGGEREREQAKQKLRAGWPGAIVIWKHIPNPTLDIERTTPLRLIPDHQ